MTSASAWSSVPPAARAKTTCESTSATRRAGRTTGASDEPVVTALARIERGSDEERAAKATRRLAACGFSSVPSWMRPYRCLSNGEAARADVAVAIAQHENNKQKYCVVNDFACVVNRDAAMSDGLRDRQVRATGAPDGTRAGHGARGLLCLPPAGLDTGQHDGSNDAAAGPGAEPRGHLGVRLERLPDEHELEDAAAGRTTQTRNTDLVREISNTYDVAPEAIERIVLGDGALPNAVATSVTMGRVAEVASQAFDFDFYGESTFVPPDFPRKKPRPGLGPRRRPRPERLRQDDGAPAAVRRRRRQGRDGRAGLEQYARRFSGV